MVSAGLYGINQFLDVLTKEEKNLKIIEKEDEYFIMDFGKKVIGVLVATEELKSLNFLLKKFIAEFEDFFLETLDNWNGDSDAFFLTSNIVANVFKKV